MPPFTKTGSIFYYSFIFTWREYFTIYVKISYFGRNFEVFIENIKHDVSKALFVHKII